MKTFLVILLIIASTSFAQKKYITEGDSILTYSSQVTEPSWVFLFVKDSADTYTDTTVCELKNAFGDWEIIGVKDMDDFTFKSSIIPGDGVSKYYLPIIKAAPGDLRLRRTNVDDRDRNTKATIERKSLD